MVTEDSFRRLLNGLDTIECAYFLDTTFGSKLDFADLRMKKEILQRTKARDSMCVEIGGTEFLLAPNGTKNGYPFILKNTDFIINCGEHNNPSFFVKFRSLALWRDGAETLHHRFLQWAEGLGLMPFRTESLSRVDFAFDYHLSKIDFDEDDFVTLSEKDNKYRKNRKIQTFNFGKGDVVLRVYDKVDEIEEESHKTWFYDLWDVKESVWRIEFQVRKDVLRRFGIRTFDDLKDSSGDLLRYLATEHDTLRIRSDDSNRSRWPLHPLWRDLQLQIEELNMQGVYRVIDPAKMTEERLHIMVISMYGYLKRIAAIRTIKDELADVTHLDALKEFRTLVDRIHDPLTWKIDVKKRADMMRLGQW